MVLSGHDPAEDEEFDDGLRDPTVTLKQWRKFVSGGIPQLELMPYEKWLNLDEAAKADDVELRIDYHSELVLVATSTVRSVTRHGRQLIMLNRKEISARRNLVVSGPWATGKTTALKVLGRTHELRVRARFPGEGRIPVVYVSTPPIGSPRKLAMEMARFLGLPEPRSRENATDVAAKVCAILRRGRCELVLIDEIHRLDSRSSGSDDMSDHIKQITEQTAATFVYGGIDVEHSAVYSGVRGQQFAARSVLLHTDLIPLGPEWTSTVADMERALRLYQHKDGTLTGLARLIHNLTGGSISNLSHLIRLAAQTAIIEGTELIDEETLCGILLPPTSGTVS